MRLTVHFPEGSPTTHEFVGSRLTVGRLGDNDVQLDDASVSSRHAEIFVQDRDVILRDLGSTNGTFLNGVQVAGEHPLKEGDAILFGGVRAVFMEPVGGVGGAPITAAPAAETSGTGFPENFRPLSPLPRAEKRRDPFGLVAWGCFGLGVAVALYALVVVLTL